MHLQKFWIVLSIPAFFGIDVVLHSQKFWIALADSNVFSQKPDAMGAKFFWSFC